MIIERIMGYDKKEADARRAVIAFNEGFRKSKPTELQIYEVKALLKDFGFKKVHIPDFDTYAELDMWRRNFLNENL